MRLAGKFTLSIDGSTLLTKVGSTLTYGPKRTFQVGPTGTHGFTEENTVAMITCTVSLSGSTSVEAFQAITNGTGLFTSDAGNSYSLSGMALMEPTAITEQNGEVKLSFGAMTCDETLAA